MTYERKFRLRTGGTIVLRIMNLKYINNEYYANINISGKNISIEVPVIGSDMIQTIYLGLRMASEIIKSMEDYKKGNIYWIGGLFNGDLGLPEFVENK